MEKFCERLCYAVKMRQVTQMALSNQTGVGQSSLSRIMRGELNPSDRTIRDLCAALNIREEWLRDGVEPMERETPDTLSAALAAQYGLSPYAARVINALAHATAALSEAEFERLAGIVIAEMKKSAPKEKQD